MKGKGEKASFTSGSLEPRRVSGRRKEDREDENGPNKLMMGK